MSTSMSTSTPVSVSTATQILQDLKEGKCTVEYAQDQLSKLKIAETKRLTYKVSPKGAISFYGIRKMPITLYDEELHQIVETVGTPEFQRFVTENRSSLSSKVKK